MIVGLPLRMKPDIDIPQWMTYGVVKLHTLKEYEGILKGDFFDSVQGFLLIYFVSISCYNTPNPSFGELRGT